MSIFDIDMNTLMDCIDQKENSLQFSSQNEVTGNYLNGGDNCYFSYDNSMEVKWHIDLKFGDVVMYLPEFLDHYNLIFVYREQGLELPKIKDEHGDIIDNIQDYLDQIDPNWIEVQDEILKQYKFM